VQKSFQNKAKRSLGINKTSLKWDKTKPISAWNATKYSGHFKRHFLRTNPECYLESEAAILAAADTQHLAENKLVSCLNPAT
jgi:hypothetical protein